MDIVKFNKIYFCLVILFLLIASSTQAKDEKQYKALEDHGIAFTEALRQHDTVALAKLFDLKGFSRKIAKLSFTDKSDIDDFMTGFLSGYETKSAFMDQIMGELVKEQFEVQFLRVVDGKSVIRIDYAEGGHEYIYLYYSARKKLPLLANDMLFLTRGKTSSKTASEVVQMAIKPSSSMIKRLFDIKEVDKAMLASLKNIFDEIKASNYDQAYELIESLPAELQKTRFVIELAIQLTQHISDDEYHKQLAKLDKYYSDDPTTSFTLIDYHFLNQDLDKVISSVEVLQNNLGDDAALQSLVSSTYYEKGDMALAKEHAKKGIALEPDFVSNYWILVNSNIETKSYAQMIEILKLIEQKFDQQFSAEDFLGDLSYAEFMESKEFKAWLGR